MASIVDLTAENPALAAQAAILARPVTPERQMADAIRVLAIDQNIEEKNGQKVVIGKTATLELAPSQVETLTMSQQMGTMSLALRSITDASQKTEAVEDTRRGGVNIVRFGVGTMTTPR